jgi:hypothetical protein
MDLEQPLLQQVLENVVVTSEDDRSMAEACYKMLSSAGARSEKSHAAGRSG